jgi:hypothetical protein
MVENAPATFRHGHVIATEPFGFARLLAALVPVWYVILTRPKAFFRSLDRPDVQVGNALGFAAIALAIYVCVQTAFEATLIRIFDHQGPTFIAYYAAAFETLGSPFAEIAAFFTIAAYFAAFAALNALSTGASAWITLKSYVHFGNVASVKSILVAVLYAGSFITLTFCLLFLPLVYLAERDDPTALFYFFSPLLAPDGPRTQYDLVLAYVYVRAIAFTTNIMLHWGLIFTLLFVYAVTSVGRLAGIL